MNRDDYQPLESLSKEDAELLEMAFQHFEQSENGDILADYVCRTIIQNRTTKVN